MKRILNVSLFLSILACLFYGLDGIFNLDLIASLSLRAPSAAVILKVIFAACGTATLACHQGSREGKRKERPERSASYSLLNRESRFPDRGLSGVYQVVGAFNNDCTAFQRYFIFHTGILQRRANAVCLILSFHVPDKNDRLHFLASCSACSL